MKSLVHPIGGLSIKRSIVRTLLFAFVLMISSHLINAQDRWQATLSTSANFPTQSLGVIDLKTGFGFDGTIGYRFMPHLYAVAGWGWNHFTPKTKGIDADFEETGYIAGLQFMHPIENWGISYLLGTSAIYNHIETEDEHGNIQNDTGHGWGWQVEGGLSIPIHKSFKVQPNIRYHALKREMEVYESTADRHLNYIAAGVKLAWSF